MTRIFQIKIKVLVDYPMMKNIITNITNNNYKIEINNRLLW